MATHLTESDLENKRLNPGDKVELADSVEAGLFARIYQKKNGSRSVLFFWRRERVVDGERVRYHEKLGPRVPKVFGLKEARKAAQQLNASLVLGEVNGAPRADGSPTVKAAWESFREKELHTAGTPRVRTRTLEGYDVSAKHFIRELGHWRIDKLDVDLVERMRDMVTETAGPRPANAALDLLGRVFRWWVTRERKRLPDPTGIVRRHKIEPREFDLKPDEVKRFLDAAEKDPMRDLWLLIAFTGCRRGEALRAHRDQFDLEARTWTIPAEGSKNKRPMVKQLVPEVVEIVKRHEGLLFPNGKGGVRTGIKKEWNQLREAAELPQWTPHTLRKLMGSTGRISGLTEGQIADLLGHRDLKSQAAYAFGNEQSVRAATETVAAELRRMAR